MLAPADYLLPWIAIALAVIAIGVGWCWPRHWLWHLADPPYYLLGISGVVLLFLTQAEDRRLYDLLDQRGRIEAELRTHLDERPRFDFRHSWSYSLDVGYLDLQAHASIGEACVGAPDAGGRCAAAREHLQLYQSAFRGLGTPPPERAVVDRLRYAEKLCPAAYSLVGRITTDERLGSAIFGEVRRALLEVEQKKLAPHDLGPIARISDSLRKRGDAHKERVLRVFSGEDRTFVEASLNADIDFAVAVFNAAAGCPGRSRQAAEHLRTLDQWSADQVRLEQRRERADAEIQKVRAIDPTARGNVEVRRFLLSLWPYALVLALALKLAKSVAAVIAAGRASTSVLRSGTRVENAGEPTGEPPTSAPTKTGGTVSDPARL